MSDCESSLLSPTRILPSMTPPISLTVATTRSWPLVLSVSHGSACTRENGILHQYRPFLIQWASFGLLIKTVILLMLHSTPFALWTSQWNRICEWSVIVLSTTNKRMISLSLTCQRNTTCNLYCFQMTLKYHFPTHSLCFWILSSNQINIIHQSIQNHHALISSSYHLFAIEIPSWHYPLHSINNHRLLPFHMISNPLIQTHSHSQPSKHTPAASILASLCNPWFQITLAVIQPIRWIHGTHNVQDMFHWRRWDQSQLSFHRRKRIPR